MHKHRIIEMEGYFYPQIENSKNDYRFLEGRPLFRSEEEALYWLKNKCPSSKLENIKPNRLHQVIAHNVPGGTKYRISVSCELTISQIDSLSDDELDALFDVTPTIDYIKGTLIEK